MEISGEVDEEGGGGGRRRFVNNLQSLSEQLSERKEKQLWEEELVEGKKVVSYINWDNAAAITWGGCACVCGGWCSSTEAGRK